MITIFEIPVYNMSKEKHYQKWAKEKNLFMNKLIFNGDTENQARDVFLRCFKFAWLWDYNKIIAFIKVLYDYKSGDIKFIVYKNEKKFFYNQINKMQFQEQLYPNLHIYVRNQNNKEIIAGIKDKIKYIKKYHFKAKNYIDDKALNNICCYINFEDMIKQAKNNY